MEAYAEQEWCGENKVMFVLRDKFQPKPVHEFCEPRPSISVCKWVTTHASQPANQASDRAYKCWLACVGVLQPKVQSFRIGSVVSTRVVLTTTFSVELYNHTFLRRYKQLQIQFVLHCFLNGYDGHSFQTS